MKLQYHALSVCVFLQIFSCNQVYATQLISSIDTTSLSGTKADIVIDLIAGDGMVLNSAIISNVQIDGLLESGTVQLIGGASGDLSSSVTLQNSSLINEVLQPVTLGTTINLNISLTENLDVNATLPDSLSLFLLDANQKNLFLTKDPSGANSLFQFDFNGTPAGNLNVYTRITASNIPVNWAVTVTTPVPVPPTLWLFVSGLIFFGYRKQQLLTE